MKYTLLFTMALMSLFSQAQQNPFTYTFRHSSSQQAGDLDTIYINLYSEFDSQEVIDLAELPTFFGDTVFRVTPQSFQVEAGLDTNTLMVVMSSRHNMNHKFFLELETAQYGTWGIQLSDAVNYAESRYNGTYNLTGEDLKAALKTAATQGHNALGYNTGRDRMYMNIDNKAVSQGASVNTLECVYSGDEISGFANRQAAQNMGFNTEHTYPQSLFNSNEPMKSDIFHLYPTKQNPNSVRANKPFGVVSNPSWTEGGSKSNNSTFEPRDEHKGYVARSMMYFVIRYQDYSNFFAGQESILRTWHDEFQPTSLEKDRNDRINQYQGNRNPFIDYPQFVERFTSFTSNGNIPVASGLSISNDSLSGLQNRAYAASVKNTGTTTFNITGFSIDDTNQFVVSDTAGDWEIQQGEGAMFVVSFKQTGAISNGVLTIETDLQGSEELEVILTGEGSVGISDIQYVETEWKAYPNPVSNTLRFTAPLKTAQVFDLTGRLVNQLSQATELDASSLLNGMYLLKGETDLGTVITYRFIKK